MEPIPALSTATLLLAGVAAARRPARDDWQDDGLVWTAISRGGDVLLGMPFDEAVRCSPLRVESLVFQRVIRPFLLLCVRLVQPWLEIDQLDQILRNAWLARNRQIRTRCGGVLPISDLASSDASSWIQNSCVLVETMELPTEGTGRVKTAMLANRQDIHRAFEECRQICDRAACLDPDCFHDWLVLKAVVDDMEAVVDHLMGDLASISPFLADIGVSFSGLDDDRFGALSMDGAYGYHGPHEEFILSGHRAPSIGLPQYRRMGGRVFG